MCSDVSCRSLPVGNASRVVGSVDGLGIGSSAELSGLERQCFRDGWSVEGFMEALAGIPVFRAYGIHDSGSLIAYVTLYEIADELEIINFGVMPSRRRQGFGRRLLTCVLQDAFKRGIVSAVLDVRTGNASAIALYEGLGFVQVGRRRGYYPDTQEDALLYRLHIESFKEHIA